MNETELIEHFFAAGAKTRADVLLGIGDDAAVTRLPADQCLVTATDTICAGTHFPAGTPPAALGHRCLAVNLSDLAAMAAEPLWCTLSLALPSADAGWLEEFAAGFFALAAEFDIALIGGDTVRGPLSITVTVHGGCRAGEQITRSGARPGDAIYLTGQPGEAAAGCRYLTQRPARSQAAAPALCERFYYPRPRVREALSLRGLASAMIDVSDSVQTDLARLLSASGVAATLETEALPLSTALVDYAGPDEALHLALTGGDDYELCFTVPPDREAAVRQRSEAWSCRLQRIGETSPGAGLRWRRNSQAFAVADTAFEHF